MMKKLFTLIALALTAQASMAQDVIASYTFPDQSSITNTATVEGQGCTVNYSKIGGSTNNEKVLDGTYYFHKFTNATSAWVKLTLTNGSFQAGDKFYATLWNGNASTDGFYFKAPTTGNVVTVTYSKTEPTTLEYTLTDDDINEDGSITVYRYSSNCYARHFEVTREAGATKQNPETSFGKAIVGFKSGETAGQAVTTNSDGAVTYESGNTSIVTVDANGALTAVAPGKTTITAKTASSSTFTASSASYTVYVLSNADGSLQNAYLPTDFRYMVETYEGEAEDAQWGWVAGYIVGTYNSGEGDVRIFSASTTSTTTQGTIGLANTLDETKGSSCLAVQLLSESEPRLNLNLADNWNMKGQKVWVHGRACLFTQSSGAVIIYGMSGTDNYSLDGTEPAIATGIETVKTADKATGEVFNLAGQRVAQPQKGLYIVGGKKVVVK